jgi:ketosteroid isomerase-like protein
MRATERAAADPSLVFASPQPGAPTACLQRVQAAINQHDLEALVACFAPDYASTFPAHPERAFGGHAQLRHNWTEIFALLPDIHATLLHAVEAGEAVWTEWEWTGTTRDGAPYLARGVTIQGVRDDRIVWTRLYMEPVQAGGHAIQEHVGRSAS